MSGVGKVSEYDEIVTGGEQFVVAKKQSSAVQARKTNIQGARRYLTDIKMKPQRKNLILSLLEGTFRIAIARKNVDYCTALAQSLGLVDEDEEEELIVKLELHFENAREEDAFAYEALEKKVKYKGIADWFESESIPFNVKQEGTLLEIINYLVKVDDASLAKKLEMQIKELKTVDREVKLNYQDWFDAENIPFTLSDDATLAEVSSHLAKLDSAQFDAELERVRVLYEIYGDDAFPWRLPSMTGYAEQYLLRSQLEEDDGENFYEEDAKCRNNNCGSRRSRIQIFEHVRTDNGKMIIRNCIKCGVVRH